MSPSSPASKTLFTPVVPTANLHADFESLRSLPGFEPARWMLDDVYQAFKDPDGNFLEQLQTTAFDARCFELYVFAYLGRSGFTIGRNHPNPDFLATKASLKVAIEVTTVGPSTSGALAKLGKKIAELSPSELGEYLRNELPIRFGSPLFTKLEHHYWELEHCRDLPIVIFIEAFHDEESLAFSDSALTSYLYGLEHVARWGPEKVLVVDWQEVGAFKVGEKIISSNFFALPGSQHISAVVFTNSGTVTKFARMGYQSGIGHEALEISRAGHCLSPAPNTMDPSWFSYSLDDPPHVESWGEGLVVLHNPNCLRPIPKDLFPEGVQTSMLDGRLITEATGWYPFSSRTLIAHLGEMKRELARLPQRPPRVAIASIPQSEFLAHSGFAMADSHPIIEENGWFVDETEAFLGVITRDKVDDDWGYAVLARDQNFRFRAIHWETSLQTRSEAGTRLRGEMTVLLSRPQRLFPQDDKGG